MALRDRTEPCPISVMFTTGRGQRVNVSEDALKKAREVIGMEPEDEFVSQTFHGFTTGNGKSIPLSKEHITKAHEILEDLNFYDLELDHSLGDPNAFLENNISHSRELVDQRELSYSDDFFDLQPTETINTHLKSNDFSFFRSGNGKLISVSENSLKEAQKLIGIECNFSSLNENSQHDSRSPSPRSSLHRKRKFSDSSDVSIKKLGSDQMYIRDVNNSITHHTEIFDSLSFSNIRSEIQLHQTKDFSNSFFQTGNGSKVDITKNGILEAKNFFDGDSGCEETNSIQGNNALESNPYS